ncbi:MAG TPA: hypothetical protein HPP51_03100 [Planctomycetes bacterium]|nr:hypothetical protein [Planctomycetota bacterium]
MAQGCAFTKDCEVSDDNIMLGRICDEHNITAKKLSLMTGRAASTVYKYLAGEATIPSVVWRSVFKLTSDQRIFELITGDEPVCCVQLPTSPAKLDLPTLDSLIRMRQKQLSCEKFVLKILEDSKITSADRKAIEDYKVKFPEMVAAQSQVFEAITKRFTGVEK